MSDPSETTTVAALVIGGGPAGLMAADCLSADGHAVLLAEAKPSFGRKFLMAGKSGLNLTKAVPKTEFVSAYLDTAPAFDHAVSEFGPEDVGAWAKGLGQELFTGSSGRVFPTAMKASPLLRAWLGRLDTQGVDLRRRWQWLGCDRAGVHRFATPEGTKLIRAKVAILALGGASWARLGSDGAWARWANDMALPVAPFAPSNVGLRVSWSDHMAAFFGEPVKGVALSAGAQRSRGEIVLSRRGLEGGGLYPLVPMIRNGAALSMDLAPDLKAHTITERLTAQSGKQTMTNRLRRGIGLSRAKIALLQEWGRPLPSDPMQLATLIKGLGVRHNGPRSMDEAISTAGGLAWEALDDRLSVRGFAGLYAAGEMIAWDAPTGGYLLTACLATGRYAGRSASEYLARAP